MYMCLFSLSYTTVYMIGYSTLCNSNSAQYQKFSALITNKYCPHTTLNVPSTQSGVGIVTVKICSNSSYGIYLILQYLSANKIDIKIQLCEETQCQCQLTQNEISVMALPSGLYAAEERVSNRIMVNTTMYNTYHIF